MKLTKAFIEDIRSLILSARSTVARGVNLVQVYANFEIGRRIVEQEQNGRDRATYGKEVLKALSDKLTTEFGNGFSLTNLKLMRQFYIQNEQRIGQTVSGQLTSKEKSQTASDRFQFLHSPAVKLPTTQLVSSRQLSLSWSHYVLLLGIKDPDERSFYEIESAREGWSLSELKRQKSSALFERLALSRDKEGVKRLAEKGQIVSKPEDVLKNPYVLEFLGLSEEARYSESDLESAIISNIENFLLELGKGFLFEARQKRFTFDEDHFFVDLVFYNRLLRCYVIIDLKLDKLTHQDLGQMQMYVNYYDRHVRTSDENPTIGILLCKKKHDALVEITLPKGSNIHAKEYQLYLPSKEELRKKLQEWAGEAEQR
ncbi:MAG: PDDEXK nuclease domain-containing protein [Lentisphaerota bacterium]|jgi:predicted nuclease of restriction endonuclease-like (RecB) superfamily